MSAARQLIDPYLEYEDEHKPALSPRRKRKRVAVPATLKICLLAACCVAVSLLYLQQQVTSYYLNVELGYLQERANTLEQHNDYLMLNLESQRSLPKVEQIARSQLGMVEPQLTIGLVFNQEEQPGANEHGRWLAEDAPGGSRGIFASLAAWLNKAFPLGGVEAGTLQR